VALLPKVRADVAEQFSPPALHPVAGDSATKQGKCDAPEPEIFIALEIDQVACRHLGGQESGGFGDCDDRVDRNVQSLPRATMLKPRSPNSDHSISH
jgi:hypothetical protein